MKTTWKAHSLFFSIHFPFFFPLRCEFPIFVEHSPPTDFNSDSIHFISFIFQFYGIWSCVVVCALIKYKVRQSVARTFTIASLFSIHSLAYYSFCCYVLCIYWIGGLATLWLSQRKLHILKAKWSKIAELTSFVSLSFTQSTFIASYLLFSRRNLYVSVANTIHTFYFILGSVSFFYTRSNSCVRLRISLNQRIR